MREEPRRRGKRHKAQAGVVNALSAAPHGYRYVRKSDHADAYYAVDEAMVRQVFAAYTQEDLSINALVRQLTAHQVPTRTGARWERGTIWKMLQNPAYYGKACFGKTAARSRAGGSRGGYGSGAGVTPFTHCAMSLSVSRSAVPVPSAALQ